MNKLTVTYVDHGKKTDRFALSETHHFRLSDGSSLVIPKGFVTDFATVPRILWGIVPPIHRGVRAFVVHDYLYLAQDRRGRRWADDEMLRMMKAAGSPWLRRTVIYSAVRVFGGLWWRKYTKS